jgi:hypothetical protein
MHFWFIGALVKHDPSMMCVSKQKNSCFWNQNDGRV